MGREKLSPFHKSASNITPSTIPEQNVQHAYCTLYSMPSRHTVWCGNQCSVLCFACCYATLHDLHTSNATKPCTRASVQKCQCLCELQCLRIDGIWLCSHSIIVTLFIVDLDGGFPRTIRSTFRSQCSPHFH